MIHNSLNPQSHETVDILVIMAGYDTFFKPTNQLIQERKDAKRSVLTMSTYRQSNIRYDDEGDAPGTPPRLTSDHVIQTVNRRMIYPQHAGTSGPEYQYTNFMTQPCHEGELMRIIQDPIGMCSAKELAHQFHSQLHERRDVFPVIDRMFHIQTDPQTGPPTPKFGPTFGQVRARFVEHDVVIDAKDEKLIFEAPSDGTECFIPLRVRVTEIGSGVATSQIQISGRGGIDEIVSVQEAMATGHVFAAAKVDPRHDIFGSLFGPLLWYKMYAIAERTSIDQLMSNLSMVNNLGSLALGVPMYLNGSRALFQSQLNSPNLFADFHQSVRRMWLLAKTIESDEVEGKTQRFSADDPTMKEIDIFMQWLSPETEKIQDVSDADVGDAVVKVVKRWQLDTLITTTEIESIYEPPRHRPTAVTPKGERHIREAMRWFLCTFYPILLQSHGTVYRITQKPGPIMFCRNLFCLMKQIIDDTYKLAPPKLFARLIDGNGPADVKMTIEGICVSPTTFHHPFNPPEGCT